ncbi:MAG: FHA domain-containing protein [Wenzhouxiangellaceae bacterium]
MSEQSPQFEFEDPFVLENQADGSKTPVEGAIEIGRGAECELVLDCMNCSRVHARMDVAGGALWVEDRHSTNGTFVNKRKISERTQLQDGDAVQFGDVRFRVIAPNPQMRENFGDKTRVASTDSLQRMLHQDDSTDSGSDKEPIPSAAGASREGAGSGGDGAESAESDRERQAEVAASGSDVDPSIPKSWADAEQLEQASYTSLVGGDAAEMPVRDSRILDSSKAIAQARMQIPEELAILIGLTEPILGTVFELPAEGPEKWEIGRDDAADIKIDADSVSGRHAQLIHERGRWKIVNMMSVNGTFVNERKTLNAYLRAGDVIRMGGVKLAFDARVAKSAPSRQAVGSSNQAISRAGQLLTAPFRWVARQWSRLRGRS